MDYDFKLKYKPLKSYTLKVGKVYLYEQFAVTEFNEGVELNFESFSEVSEIILISYRNKPFGFIAYRKNSYSIKLEDVFACNDTFSNLKAYAIITQNSLTADIIKIENLFFNFNRKIFSDFESAKSWVEKTLEKETNLVLQ